MADDVDDKRSGSQKIRDAFKSQGALDRSKLDWLGTIPYGRLHQIWVHGQPNPDRFGGIVEIDPGSEGEFMKDAVKNWDPPFKIQLLRKNPLFGFSWPDGQPSVGGTPDKS